MAKHKEADFIIPVIRVIYENGGSCVMSTIKDQVSNYITLTPEDYEPMPSRSKTEPCYRQIVGNLVSHNPSAFSKYVDRENYIDKKGVQSKVYTLKLNEEGIKYAESFESKQHVVVLNNSCLETDASYDFEEINSKFNTMIMDSASLVDYQDVKVVNAANNRQFKRSNLTDNSLGQSIIKLNNYVCQYGRIIGENHQYHNDKNGNNYVEPHHLIPMKASKDFYPRSLDRPSNIIPLCPVCHNLLHHGSNDEIRKVLKSLYDEYIQGLNNDDIYITFDDLFEKYYKRR